MAIPLKISDPGKLLSKAAAAHVRQRTEKLSRFFAGIRRCGVTVDGPGKHPLEGRVRVRVSVSLPDATIAINRQSGDDVAQAIRESFDAADQRLEDHARLVRQASRDARRRPSRKA